MVQGGGSIAFKEPRRHGQVNESEEVILDSLLAVIYATAIKAVPAQGDMARAAEERLKKMERAGGVGDTSCGIC